MAHGSKRWIRDHTGRVKRSTDRTKKDRYARLEYWNEWDGPRRWYSSRRRGDFCPQCKHVQKAVHDTHDVWWRARNALYDEWYDEYGNMGMLHPRFVPFWKYMGDRRDRMTTPWTYDTRSYLCYKHERWYEQKRERWNRAYPGNKERYGWMTYYERRSYRREVKHLLARAQYDERYYELVPPKQVHGWLD